MNIDFFNIAHYIFNHICIEKLIVYLNAYNYDKNKNRAEIMPRQLSDIKKPLQI